MTSKETIKLWYDVIHEHLAKYKALPPATCFNILLVLLKERNVISFLYCEEILINLIEAIRIVLDIKDIKVTYNQNKIFVHSAEMKIDDKTEDDCLLLNEQGSNCRVLFHFNGANFITLDINHTEAKLKFLRGKLDRYKKIGMELASGVTMSVIF